ncbi:hypothetical protein HMPREF0083_00430 [Aneurinibacillus aneurinilyticus ATCC 12856]|uniref:Uncharacterized protein n=1 Tax=Aneurinibacillus aneurinilyticus ATCC 12856 TaxID=649747 RepID=U1XA68_ANEAE|nr:hypothetical protein HMPREF0083_00430 [Aneurinibacillus aneurinilyticus ATCC 12856]
MGGVLCLPGITAIGTRMSDLTVPFFSWFCVLGIAHMQLVSTFHT